MKDHSETLYLYPTWVRIWHGINAILFLLLIITGLSMQYSSSDYHSWLSFDKSVKIHNLSGVILTMNYFFFLIVNFLSGNYSYYKFEPKKILKKVIIQFNYYTNGIFKKVPAPFPISQSQKFNPLQQFTYFIIIYIIVALIIITGWGLLFPQMLVNKIFGFPGLFLNAFFHVILAYLCSMFLLIHIYFCTIGTTFWSNFKSIITGWHKVHKTT